MGTKLKVNKGDKIKIEHPRAGTLRGTVISATNWGYTEEKPDWYIEYDNDPNGYAYWKQGVDGGKLVEVNGKKV